MDSIFSMPNPRDFDYLIVGAGLSGSVAAHLLAKKYPNRKILVIDQRDHIGGNCYDYIETQTGIRVNKYGAHLFHTNNERVWDFIQPFATWVRWDHRVYANIVDDTKKQTLVNLPININTVNSICGTNITNETEMNRWLNENRESDGGSGDDGSENGSENGETVVTRKVGRKIYQTLFHNYTYKQWDKYPRELDASVLARIPVRTNHDDRYFSDRYQALPLEGYTSIFEKLLALDNITVRLETDFHRFQEFKPENLSNWSSGDKKPVIIYTGPIDSYFAGIGLPRLEYRSINFYQEIIRNCEYYQPNSVVNYPGGEVDFTRIVEYKHFLNNPTDSRDTIIVRERSTSSGEPYYPVPNKRNREVYEDYQKRALGLQEVYPIHFLGRLANYKYLNMDQAILAALDWFNQSG